MVRVKTLHLLIAAVTMEAIEGRKGKLAIGGTNMPTLSTQACPVTAIPAASSKDAQAHFETLLTFETDCWDVHAELGNHECAFVVLDVRGPESFAAGHLPEAISLPYGRINERNLAQYPAET